MDNMEINLVNQYLNKGLDVNGMKNAGKIDTMGNGNVFYTGGESIEELAERQAKEKLNKAIEKKQQEIEERLKKDEEKSKNAEKYLHMEIVPINSYVLVRPMKENPFEKLDVTGSGIVIPTISGVFINPDTGLEDKKEKLETVGEVIEVSPMNKFVKVGDTVMYRRMQGVPVPFFGQGFEVVAESSILVIINEGVTERFKNLNV